jgi:hypothetical protein
MPATSIGVKHDSPFIAILPISAIGCKVPISLFAALIGVEDGVRSNELLQGFQIHLPIAYRGAHQSTSIPGCCILLKVSVDRFVLDRSWCLRWHFPLCGMDIPLANWSKSIRLGGTAGKDDLGRPIAHRAIYAIGWPRAGSTAYCAASRLILGLCLEGWPYFSRFL